MKNVSFDILENLEIKETSFMNFLFDKVEQFEAFDLLCGQFFEDNYETC